MRWLVALSLAAFGCGGAPAPAPVTPPASPVEAPTPVDAEAAACEANATALDATDPADSVSSVFESFDGKIAEVRVKATSPDLRARAKAILKTRAGQAASDDAIRADVKRLWTLGGLEDVQVRTFGSKNARVVEFAPRSAPTVRSVYHRGDRGTQELGLGLAPGKSYQAAAVAAGLSTAKEQLFEQGFREAGITITGQRVNDGRVDVCVHLHKGRKLRLKRVTITGNAKVPTPELASLVQARPGQPLRDAQLERDILSVQALYYDRGFITANVAPPKISVVDGALVVRISITEGRVFKIGSIQVQGDLATTKRAYLRRLSMKAGDVFNRSKLQADLARLVALHKEQNAPEVNVTPETKLDPAKGRVDIVLVVRAVPKQPLK